MENIYLMNIYLTKVFTLKTKKARKNYLNKVLKSLSDKDALMLIDITKDLIN